MNVEYTGRQFEITNAIRTEVESGLTKLTRILGENITSKVILTAEKQRRIAEINVTARRKSYVGLAENSDMKTAVAESLARIEKQALKHNERRRDTKRVTKVWKQIEPARAVPQQLARAVNENFEVSMAVGASASTAVPIVVHKFPAQQRITEAHLVHTQDAVALRPMTIEEAVKECEFRDRDVFVFRDKKGVLRIIHRTRDGKLELIEAP